MNLAVVVATFAAIGFVLWCIAGQTLAIEEYRATQITPIIPVENPPPAHPAPEVERHISWTLDTDEFEQVHQTLLEEELLKDQARWAQARGWLDEILVDIRDGVTV